MTEQQIQEFASKLTAAQLEDIKARGKLRRDHEFADLVRVYYPDANTSDVKTAYDYIRDRNVTTDKEPVREQEYTFDIKGDKANLTGETNERIRTEEDLYRVFEIDPDVWEVERMKAGGWTTSMKLKDGEGNEVPHLQQNYKIEATLTKRVREIAWRQVADKLIHKIEQAAPAYHAPQKDGENLLLLSLPDPHFGKLAAFGHAWSLKEATEQYLGAVTYLTEKAASSFKIGRCLCVIGNDSTQVDGRYCGTTKGTVVGYDALWEEQYVAVEEAYRWKIIHCLDMFGSVDVLTVPGNHDQATGFTLGRVMRAQFHNTPEVRVDTRPILRKYYQYGVVALGFTHGNEVKGKDLPAKMMLEQPAMMDECWLREYHTGHLHHRSKDTPGDYREIESVIVRLSPALCPPDTWHVDQGFGSALRGAEAFVYNKNEGIVGQYPYNIAPQRSEKLEPMVGT